MQISRVFLHSTLFVEVSHASDIAVIRNASANMSNSGDFRPQLEQFVPKCLEAQHKEVVNLAFAGRNEGNEGTSKRASKIWVRKEEFELRFKDKKDPTPWANIQPEHLPTLRQKRKDFNSNLRIQFPMESGPKRSASGIPRGRDGSQGAPKVGGVIPDPTTIQNRYEVLTETSE